MSASFSRLLRISRPRFRLYTAGPVLVATAASGFFSVSQASILYVLFFMMLVYALFPINLLIYGVNDVADGDTDQRNQKKQGYEEQLSASSVSGLLRAVWQWTGGGLIVLSGLCRYASSIGLLSVSSGQIFALGVCVVLFLFTALGYSLAPIRAKARPFVDGLFNVLYILPGGMTYILFAGTESIYRSGLIAGWLWCMAMHAYSAIPDISADMKAGLRTSAVVLGTTGTLLYCAVLRGGAAVLIAGWSRRFALIAGVVYIAACAVSLVVSPFTVYKTFPLINALIGAGVFWLLVLG